MASHDNQLLASVRNDVKNQKGFTLIELLVVVAISAILVMASAAALRHFWFVHALESSADSVASQMRQAQQQAESESHPLVYGVWFINVGDNTRWGTLQYDPALANPCTEIGKRSFETGVSVSAVSFDVDPVRTPACRSALSTAGIPSASNAQIAFFYARGTATPGSLTLEQLQLERNKGLTVTGITGRVDES
jgi:prepilin-type N-terminal cleavage/methylation domain-containing protein